MPGTRGGRIKKCRKSPITTRSVLRMMAIMERSGEEVPKEFLETGRTGRRNAMPDILQPAGASLTTADLPLRLQRVTIVTPDKDAQAGPSKTDFSAQKDDSPAEPKGCS